jgi:hypothetical protein
MSSLGKSDTHPDRFPAAAMGTRQHDPLGVDTHYQSRTAGGAGLVVVGGDFRQDHAMLIYAARVADVPVTLAAINGASRPEPATSVEAAI